MWKTISTFPLLLRTAFKWRDTKCITSSKGDEAIEAFHKVDYDICILDVMLPNVDGFTIAKAIRNKNYQIPIIFISARIQLEDKLEALNIGGDDYLLNPLALKSCCLKSPSS